MSITIKYAPLSYQIGGNRKRSEQSMNADHNSHSRNSVFDYHLLPVGRQTAIKHCVSNKLRSMFVHSINVFDCCLSGVFIEYTEYVAKTIRNKG